MIFGWGISGQTRLRRVGRRYDGFRTLFIGRQKAEILLLARAINLDQLSIDRVAGYRH
jgi:hypothetical protein